MNKVRQLSSRAYLAGCYILNLECDLGCPIKTFFHLPGARLELVSWVDGSGEARAKVTQRGGLSASDGLQDRAGSEAERRQAV
jgi:hypothetical protein